MKKIATLMILILMLSILCACSEDTTATVNPMVEAYRQSAQNLLDQGDLDGAILALEQGVADTNDEGLVSMLEEIKAQKEAEAKASEETNDTTEEPTVETTQSPIEPSVSDAYIQDESAIPQIDLPYENITTINQEIYDSLYEGLNGGYFGCSYEWYVNDDVLSLIITQTGDSWSSYTAYNVSVSSGEALKKEDILKILGWDHNTYMAKITPTVANHFDTVNSWASNESYYWDVKEQTLQEANLATAQLYFGEDGVLCAIVTMGSFVGADSVQDIVEIPGNADELYSDVELTRPPVIAEPIVIYLISHPIVGEAYCLDPNNPDDGFTDLPSYIAANGITDYTIVDLTQQEPTFNIYDYLGTWSDGSLTVYVSESGITVEGASYGGSGRSADFVTYLTLSDVSSGAVTFQFTDSWLNTGTMHLSFNDGYLYAYVTDFVSEPSAMWGFYLDEFTLYRS